MKLITFAVPCYNSASYMSRSIDSIIEGSAGFDTEIILINDGSTDDTGKVADGYAERYPGIVRVIHQENGGHGEGVNQGIKNARGMYYKVLDSDDWFDKEALKKVLARLKGFMEAEENNSEANPEHAQNNETETDGVSGSNPPLSADLVICNYVYEHVSDGSSRIIRYRNIFPEDKLIAWSEMQPFRLYQNLLMHSLIYKTSVLRECGMVLPKHTFYVDNIYAYQPLPYVKSVCYMDVDLYRYYIGREDQSVNKNVMVGRVDQQILITKLMTECCDLGELRVKERALSKYMVQYLAMMYTICLVLLNLDGSPEALAKKKELWSWLNEKDPKLYRKLKYRSLAMGENLPGAVGRYLGTLGYSITQKIFKFS